MTKCACAKPKRGALMGLPGFSAAVSAGGDGTGSSHSGWTGSGTGHASQGLCKGRHTGHVQAANLASRSVLSQ